MSTTFLTLVSVALIVAQSSEENCRTIESCFACTQRDGCSWNNNLDKCVTFTECVSHKAFFGTTCDQCSPIDVCTTHDQCGDDEYCFSCQSCLKGLRHDRDFACRMCSSGSAGGCASVASCGYYEDSITGGCPGSGGYCRVLKLMRLKDLEKIPNDNVLTAASDADCSKHCSSLPECTAWSRNRTKDICYLSQQAAQTVEFSKDTSKTMNSGKRCDEGVVMGEYKPLEAEDVWCMGDETFDDTLANTVATAEDGSGLTRRCNADGSWDLSGSSMVRPVLSILFALGTGILFFPL